MEVTTMDENNTQTTENTGSTENTGATQENNQSNNTATETVKTFTQAEVDALIEKRLARERKKFQQQGTNNTAQGQQEQTTDTTGAGTTQVEVDVTEDARQQANAIIAQANQRLIQAVAQSEATKLNINPEYIADAVRLADLSKVTVGDDGTIDTKSVTTALEAVLTRIPVLKAATEAPAGGFKVGGQGGNNQTNGWNSNATKNSGETKRWNRNRY
jgi:hypothetical protein